MPYKPFIRYLRNFLEKEKKFDLSKSIWRLSDMDFNIGRYLREHQKNNADLKILLSDNFEFIISAAGHYENKQETFWEKLDAHGDNLLLIVDMIINEETWKNLFGKSIHDLLKNINSKKHFAAIYDMISALVKSKSIPCHSIEKNKFYIIIYRLRSLIKKDIASLCESKNFQLDNFLHWERNSGLYFYPDFNFEKRVVEKLTADELYNQLNGIVQAASKFSSIYTKKDKIFDILAYRLKDHPKAKELFKFLMEMDINKILKIKKSDKKIYFTDHATRLLTSRGLPKDPNELYSVLMKAVTYENKCRKLYTVCNNYLTYLYEERLKKPNDQMLIKKYNKIHQLTCHAKNNNLNLFKKDLSEEAKILIGGSRDSYRITFLKVVASILSLGIAIGFGIFSVKGGKVCEEIDDALLEGNRPF